MRLSLRCISFFSAASLRQLSSQHITSRKIRLDYQQAVIPHSTMVSPLSSTFAINSEEGNKISMLTWNIDGLDGGNFAPRIDAVCDILSRIRADFVFLQEVVHGHIEKLTKLNKLYDVHFSNRDAPYFTAILVNKEFSVRNHEVVRFQNTQMDRELQIVEGTFGSFHIFLLTTHLESLKECSNQRVQQLKQCFNRIETISKNHPDALIFFGGDLNLRDRELSPIPEGFADAWMAAGSPKNEKFTWDTSVNTNKQINFNLTCRFDRVFFKAHPLNKVSFTLEGKQMVSNGLSYPSDHWAIHSVYST